MPKSARRAGQPTVRTRLVSIPEGHERLQPFLLEPRTKDRGGSCQYVRHPRRAVGTLVGQFGTDGGVPKLAPTSLQAQPIAISRLKVVLGRQWSSGRTNRNAAT